MNSVLSLVVAVGLVASAQAINDKCFSAQRPHKLYNAKFKPLEGLFQVDQVMLSAPFNREQGRHALFKGTPVEICIAGRATGISQPVQFLQNACWGQLQSDVPLIGTLLNMVNTPFCDIEKNGCSTIEPACPIAPNQEFCFCSTLNVPSATPDLNVKTVWKILSTPNADVTCETEFSSSDLVAKGKTTLVAVAIDAMLRPQPNNIAQING